MSHGRSPYAHSDVRTKEQEARKAQQHADQLACEAWNERLAKLGGPLRPSPTLRAAISGGYGFLRVECNGCQQQAWIDLAKVRRPPDTWIWQLEGALACQLCRERSKFPPRSRIQMLCERHGQLGALRHEDRD